MEPLIYAIMKYLGPAGRMIGGSKSGYRTEHPNNRVFFNACIYDKTPSQVWWGDIDITLDEFKLNQIAEYHTQRFYVTPEFGYRSDFNHKIKKRDLEKDKNVLVFN